MEPAPSPHTAIRRTFPVPPPGQSVRFGVGRGQVVVEGKRQGVQLLFHDGESVAERLLGLPPEGGMLELRGRPPEHACAVQLGVPVDLVPGGSVRGCLRLPLQYELSFVGPFGTLSLHAFPVPGLRTAWEDGPEGGRYVHHWNCALHAAPEALRSDEAWLWIPVRFVHRGEGLVSVQTVRLELDAREIWECRGCVLAAPRRFLWQSGGRIREEVRWRASSSGGDGRVAAGVSGRGA